AATVAAALVVLLGGGALMLVREARLRAQAEASRAQAEDLASFMLFDLQARLRGLGRLDLLDKVARKAKAHFEAAPLLPGDAEDLRKRGSTFCLVGDVLRAKADTRGA